MNLDDLPWEDIKQVTQEEKFKEKFDKIPKSTFEFVLNDENREALIRSASRHLRQTNPTASYSQAVLLADIMQHFAKKILEG